MKKLFCWLRRLPLWGPAFAQKGGAGVQEGQDSAMSPPQGRGGAVSRSSGAAGMKARAGTTRTAKKSKGKKSQ